MPTITIDGKAFTFEGKKLIIQVAKEQDLEIPHYCYHPGLSVVASCRICLAEVAQPNPRNNNKVELIPKLVPTCQTLAVDGMEVHTQSPKAIANQKAVMEYLLINHPLDCPVCDQAGECHLQDYSYRYGRAESRFEEEKVKQPKKDIGPHVYLYSDRCIMCSRCVRFTREVTGTGEIGVVGRGHKEQIDVFPGKPLDNELSGNVVDICPVGALLDKDFLFSQRVWFLTKTPSIDGLTASGDNIWIEHNEGQVYRVKPRENMQINKWWISDEIRYGWKFIHSDQRLRTPMRKQYGVMTESDWKHAYRHVCDTWRALVRESGPGSLAAMISPMLSCEDAYLLGKMIRMVDPQALLAVGPIPRHGQDKAFPSGYTIHAEKCPNSRGVRRALELLTSSTGKTFGEVSESSPAAAGGVISFEQLIERLKDPDAGISGILLTGNYPNSWVSKDLLSAIKKKFTVLLDTLASDLSSQTDVLLPAATWAEKAGCFENADCLIQSFQQAIPVLEMAKPEGQIALDLAATYSTNPSVVFNAEKTRSQMGGIFESDIHRPQQTPPQEPEMVYVAL